MDAALLEELLKRPIAFHRIFARVAGGAVAGLFLSQLHYWTPRGSHEDGWIYKDAGEWEEETTLTLAQQRTARRDLRERGFLEEDYAFAHFPQFNKFDKTLCFKLNVNLLFAAIEQINKALTLAVAEDAELASRAEKPQRNTSEAQTLAVAEDAVLASRKNKGVKKISSGVQKKQFTEHRVLPENTPPQTPEENSGGGELLDIFLKECGEQATAKLKNELGERIECLKDDLADGSPEQATLAGKVLETMVRQGKIKESLAGLARNLCRKAVKGQISKTIAEAKIEILERQQNHEKMARLLIGKVFIGTVNSDAEKCKFSFSTDGGGRVYVYNIKGKKEIASIPFDNIEVVGILSAVKDTRLQPA